MDTKICSKCGEKKNKENFPKNRRVCYECNREYYRKYYKKNKEILSARYTQWSKENKEKVNLRKIRWAKNNKEKVKQAERKWLENNKEQRKKINRNYYHNVLKNDVQWRIKNSLSGRVREALKGNSKSDSTLKLLGCNLLELTKHLEKQFTKGMSWQNYGTWHIDHIKPCASFDLTQESEQKKCFHYSNLQPLWAEDNLRKGDRY